MSTTVLEPVNDCTAVRISLLFDGDRHARQACTALRDAHQQRSDRAIADEGDCADTSVAHPSNVGAPVNGRWVRIADKVKSRRINFNAVNQRSRCI